MPKRLVFADDGSLAADSAWLWINYHPWPGWHIDVVTILRSEHGHGHALQPFDPHHPRELIRPAADTQIDHLHADGDPRDILAQITDTNLIVLGPKGRGLAKAMHLGSVAEALAADPPAPTLIARHGRRTRRIVMFSDGTAECREAVGALSALPWLDRTEILVISAAGVGVDAQACTAEDAALLRTTGSVVTEQVLPQDEMQVFHDVPAQLLEAANRFRADLIVHGCPGLSAWRSWVQGSIAPTLTAGSSASVLVARADS